MEAQGRVLFCRCEYESNTLCLHPYNTSTSPLFLDFSCLNVGFLRTRRSLNVRPNIPRAFSVSGGIREGVHSDLELYHALLHAHVNMSTSKREM